MLKNFKFMRIKTILMTTVLSLSLILPPIIVDAATSDAIPFPYNSEYPYGTFSSLADNQSTAVELLRSEWEQWKSERITTSGAKGFRRVQRDASTSFDTVSEGLGYGMILAVYFGEQQLFDDLYNYVKSYLNTNKLMSWHIDSSGNIVGTDGIGAATDADEDIAVALVFAHKKWGSSGTIKYEAEGKNYINNIYNKMVEPGTYVLKPGDTFGGSACTNPSYFAPAWYRIFADFTGNSAWNNVADKCYEIVDNARKYNNNTGLVPDWCTANGTQSTGRGYDFKYDAIRYQWRAAIDYSWYGTTKAKTNCDQISNFFKNIGFANVKDGYTITGSQISANHSSTFVSCVAAAAMTGNDSTYAKNIYNENIKTKDSGNYTYYGNSLRLMVLLYTTGNFPNLYKFSPQNYVKGDVNSDGSVDALDFAELKRALLAQTFTSINISSADMNDDGNIDAIDFALLKVKILNR
ncbi:MAG: glycosyl hydrolase family 8 [Ruminiclostridium sp.]